MRAPSRPYQYRQSLRELPRVRRGGARPGQARARPRRGRSTLQERLQALRRRAQLERGPAPRVARHPCTGEALFAHKPCKRYHYATEATFIFLGWVVSCAKQGQKLGHVLPMMPPEGYPPLPTEASCT